MLSSLRQTPTRSHTQYEIALSSGLAATNSKEKSFRYQAGWDGCSCFRMRPDQVGRSELQHKHFYAGCRAYSAVQTACRECDRV
jgi:hypothetical protein